MSTIIDVAKEAGVSPGTVSRFMNGVLVKERNRLNIGDAIKKLNFSPNLAARSLKTSKTYVVGVVVPSLGDFYTNSQVMKIEQKLYESGYSIILCDTISNHLTEEKRVNLLSQNMVDGLIICSCSKNPEYMERLKEKGIPVVLVDYGSSSSICDQVLVDNIGAVYEPVQYLINNNHKRIALINGDLKSFTGRERFEGYRRALADYMIEIDERYVKNTYFNEQCAHDALIQLMELSNPPTAIITSSYHLTIGALEAIQDMNIKIPDELSFIGFDNVGITKLIRPHLSIIEQPMNEIGEMAAELLLKRINGDFSGFPTVLRLKTKFISKNSVIEKRVVQ